MVPKCRCCQWVERWEWWFYRLVCRRNLRVFHARNVSAARFAWPDDPGEEVVQKHVTKMAALLGWRFPCLFEEAVVLAALVDATDFTDCEKGRIIQLGNELLERRHGSGWRGAGWQAYVLGRPKSGPFAGELVERIQSFPWRDRGVLHARWPRLFREVHPAGPGVHLRA
jgi:hypothetical protein